MDRWKEAQRGRKARPNELGVVRQNIPAATERMLHLREAAEYIGMTASGLRKLVGRKEIRYCQRKSHSPILFKPEWLDEYVAKHTLIPKDELPPVAPRTRKKRRLVSQIDRHDDRHGFG